MKVFNARVKIHKRNGEWGFITYKKQSSKARFMAFISSRYRWEFVSFYDWKSKEYLYSERNPNLLSQ